MQLGLPFLLLNVLLFSIPVYNKRLPFIHRDHALDEQFLVEKLADIDSKRLKPRATGQQHSEEVAHTKSRLQADHSFKRAGGSPAGFGTSQEEHELKKIDDLLESNLRRLNLVKHRTIFYQQTNPMRAAEHSYIDHASSILSKIQIKSLQLRLALLYKRDVLQEKMQTVKGSSERHRNHDKLEQAAVRVQNQEFQLRWSWDMLIAHEDTIRHDSPDLLRGLPRLESSVAIEDGSTEKSVNYKVQNTQGWLSKLKNHLSSPEGKKQIVAAGIGVLVGGASVGTGLGTRLYEKMKGSPGSHLLAIQNQNTMPMYQSHPQPQQFVPSDSKQKASRPAVSPENVGGLTVPWYAPVDAPFANPKTVPWVRPAGEPLSAPVDAIKTEPASRKRKIRLGKRR